VVAVAAATAEVAPGGKRVRGGRERARSFPRSGNPVAVMREREGQGLDTADELWGSLVSFSRFRRGIVRRRMAELIVGVISW
jgi:hypothetical protein